MPKEQGYSWKKEPTPRKWTPESILAAEMHTRGLQITRVRQYDKTAIIPPMTSDSSSAMVRGNIIQHEKIQPIIIRKADEKVETDVKPQFSTEEQWITITNVMKQLIKEENEQVMELFANATSGKKANGTEVVTLFEKILEKLSPEVLDLFPGGHYNMAVQLAGSFMTSPEAYLLPAKRRNQEGHIVPTYVVVYKNPLQADSSYTDRN
jgi:hypothetical protein